MLERFENANRSEKLRIIRYILGNFSKTNQDKIQGLCHAIGYHCDDKFIRFLIKRIDDVNSHESGGVTPLHVAVRHNNLKAAKILIECGSHIDLATDNNEYNPLSFAIECGFDDMALFLLSKGANPNYQLSHNQCLTPFLIACAFDRIKVVNEILKSTTQKPQINICDIHGTTALKYSIINHNYDLMNQLIDLGATINQVSQIDQSHQSALDLAFETENIAAQKILRDHNGLTALEIFEEEIKSTKQTLKLNCETRNKLRRLSADQIEKISTELKKDDLLDKLKNIFIESLTEKETSSQLAISLGFLSQCIIDDNNLIFKEDLYNQVALLNCELHHKYSFNYNKSSGTISFSGEDLLDKVLPIMLYDLLATINKSSNNELNQASQSLQIEFTQIVEKLTDIKLNQIQQPSLAMQTVRRLTREIPCPIS